MRTAIRRSRFFSLSTTVVLAILFALGHQIDASASVEIVIVDPFPTKQFSVARHEEFTSYGIKYRVIDYEGGTAHGVSVTEHLSFPYTFVQMGLHTAVEILLPPDATWAALSFNDNCDSCGTTSIKINGESSLPVEKLSYLSSSQIGGTNLTVTGSAPYSQQLVIDGAIQSLSIGGSQLYVHGVSLEGVPEPSSVLFALAATATVFLAWRHRN